MAQQATREADPMQGDLLRVLTTATVGLGLGLGAATALAADFFAG